MTTMHNRPCKNFAEGHCKFGHKCKFSHDPATPCYYFQTRKGCAKGDTCVFSHLPHLPNSVAPPGPRKATSGSSDVNQDYEDRFRQWTYLIPRIGGGRPVQQRTPDLRKIFSTGWELMTESDTGGRQKLIKKLASDEGLNMIRTLVDAMDSEQEDGAILTLFNCCVVPFYRIISHPDVLLSLVLETALETIYNFLYGSGGHRVDRVFLFTAKAISLSVTQPGDGLHEGKSPILKACLSAMESIVELNQGAQLRHELVPAVEAITACAPPDDLLPESRRKLEKIRLRLGLGSLMPVARKPKSELAKQATFKFDQDLPGNLSSHGPRHDNDHEDFADIQVLPTAEEIQCSRLEYLPSTASASNHLTGVPGLLDRNFRLLREDAIGGLRDAVRREVDRMEKRSLPTALPGHINQERTHVYQDIQLRKWEIDRRRGVQLLAEFDQPAVAGSGSTQQRKDWWDSSRRLQPSSLVCLVSSTGRTIFCLVCDPTPTPPSKKKSREGDDEGDDDDLPSVAEMEYRRKTMEMPSLFKDAKTAGVVLTLVQDDYQQIAWISRHFHRTEMSDTISLVEFPGVLLPSFQPTLEALQQMSNTLDLPFADQLAPETPEEAQSPIGCPLYTLQPGFSFDLSPLTNGRLLRYSARAPFDYETFSENTSLDDAQQRAVIHALNTSLALIQGPPGTGKSYTGISIIKVLLRNRDAGQLGPIICVCYTNHALDQLLEHLVKDGVEQVVRIGSRSKSEVLQNVTLHKLTQEITLTREESGEKYHLYKQLESSLAEIEMLLKELNSVASEESIRGYLERNWSQHFSQLFQPAMEEDGFTLVRGRNKDIIQQWLREAAPGNSRDRPIEYLTRISLAAMSASERQRLHAYWLQGCTESLEDQLDHALEPYSETRRGLDKIYKEHQRRALSAAHIVGVTTSGLARNLEVLRRLQSKVLVCEEAGEVLEAHTLTALLPSIEHAILIGDHEQLRPQVKDYELCHDNPRGKSIALDISLFERLVKPGHNPLTTPPVPFSRLNIQRRMYSTIADLVRRTIYTDLKDHDTVNYYPPVHGMKDRLFWMTHDNKEDHTQSQSSSKSNEFEVGMVSALASHLMRQGTYSDGDIVILTPYVQQLQKIRRSLSGMFEIIMSEKDMEALEEEELSNAQSRPARVAAVKKTTLLNTLRVATVDNFQGEEAKVIILSFVRSNAERKCGFLRTTNRINVALSRAQHGMYIIGDAQTATSVSMWAEVIKILEARDCIGDALALSCSRHPDTRISVRASDEFAVFSPEGGCSQRCTWRLQCGHACPNKCHTTSAERLATERSLVHSATKLAQSNVLILTATRSATSHVLPVPRHVRGPALMGNVKCHAPFHVTDCHARSTCGDESVKSMMVDYFEALTYAEIKLDEDPCIFPTCGHVITLENLDQHMSMKEHYEYSTDESGNEIIVAPKSGSSPLSSRVQKACPVCRSPLRNIHRYGRIERRAWIDEATKKFIVWANAMFIPLAARMQEVEIQFGVEPTDADGNKEIVHRLQALGLATLTIRGPPESQMKKISEHTRNDKRFHEAFRLWNHVARFLIQVSEKEQPFGRIYDLVQDAKRHRGAAGNMAWTPDVLQTRNRHLASILLLRCEYAILVNFLQAKKRMGAVIKFDLQPYQDKCECLIDEATARSQPANEAEGHLFWARFLALKRGMSDAIPDGSPPLMIARDHLSRARELCKTYSGQTKGMLSEVEHVEQMLRDSTFYATVTTEEKAAVYAAMASDFRGTGHWYYCERGHPFTVGECGMPMQTSRCPQCGAAVGGQSHQSVAGVTRAEDMDAMFAGRVTR
ncbi:MAG: hypothetical protein Q9202_004787 [Teloschistes flavicans]